jgi:hypothetical protein
MNFGPARQLMDDNRFGGAGSLLPHRYGLRHETWERLTTLTRKTVAAGRQRHLQAWQAKSFKDLLRQADVHGPDHATTVGATPLMMAAAAGNAALVRALLDKGASPQIRDEFGHTAWDHALSRALQEPGFAGTGLAAVFELLAPAALDVQTNGRLVRLERQQGEYWVLMLMLAGLKTQWSRSVTRKLEVWKYGQGFFADQLHDVLAELPSWLWPEARRKRTYINQVLARAEARSAYRPARKLWVRTQNGYYLPNPAMLLRVAGGGVIDAGEGWVPTFDAMALDWIDRGCGNDDPYRVRPAALVDLVVKTDATLDEDFSGQAVAPQTIRR